MCACIALHFSLAPYQRLYPSSPVCHRKGREGRKETKIYHGDTESRRPRRKNGGKAKSKSKPENSREHGESQVTGNRRGKSKTLPQRAQRTQRGKQKIENAKAR